MSDLVDEDGYPTAAAIRQLRTFVGTARGLITYLDSIWWPDGRMNQLSKHGPTLGGYDVHMWHTVTGGWSGNEEILAELEKTIFWMLFWQSSVRGGTTVFFVKDDMVDVSMFLGNPVWEVT